MIVPVKETAPRDPQSEAVNGVAECKEFVKPVQGYKEKVFFHDVGAKRDGSTFVSLANTDVVGRPLAIVLRYNRNELPQLTEWKMMGKGCYVCGLEPGTVSPIGRAAAREKGIMPMIEPQRMYHVKVDSRF